MKTVHYPTEYWKSASPEKFNISPETINNFDKIIREDFSHIKSFLVVKNDSIIYEKYLNGCSQNTLHETACVFKSFISAMIGIALRSNLIQDLDTKIIDIFAESVPENIDKNFNKITLKHLLTKTSGIEWPSRTHYFPENQRYNDIRLPFSLKVKSTPGTEFEYKPDPYILTLALEKLSGIDFVSYINKCLFAPLGIKDYLWNNDFYEDECLLMKTRDIAKLGCLYLNNGFWEDQQLISPEYISESTKEHVYGHFPENNPYGYLWWLSRVEDYEAFYAGGFGGQYLNIIPKLSLIFVITSSMDRPHPENKMLVKEFVKGMQSNYNKLSSNTKSISSLLDLSKEERVNLLHMTKSFFNDERNIELDATEAEVILDFFLEDLGKLFYNKALDDASVFFNKRLEDIEVDYEMLYK